MENYKYSIRAKNRNIPAAFLLLAQNDKKGAERG